MPMWAHRIDLAQHLYLLRVVLIVAAVALGAVVARGLDEARRWLRHRAR